MEGFDSVLITEISITKPLRIGTPFPEYRSLRIYLEKLGFIRIMMSVGLIICSGLSREMNIH